MLCKIKQKAKKKTASELYIAFAKHRCRTSNSDKGWTYKERHNEICIKEKLDMAAIRTRKKVLTMKREVHTIERARSSLK